MNTRQIYYLGKYEKQFLKDPCLRTWIEKELYALTCEWNTEDWRCVRTRKYYNDLKDARTRLQRQVVAYRYVAEFLGISEGVVNANIERWNTSVYSKASN